MIPLYKKYTSVDFSLPYEKIKNDFSITVPEHFNFTKDVLDVYAKEDSERLALIWVNDRDEEKRFTFSQMALCVNKTANFLLSKGIKKGDCVMLMLRRRYEFWFFILALHKLGAIACPATYLLTQNEILLRVKNANVKMIVALNEEDTLLQIEKIFPLQNVQFVLANGQRKNWISFEKDFLNQSEVFIDSENNKNFSSDPMLVYFTSGTSGLPKMVKHNFAYPLGHIITAKYWQEVEDGGLHLTVAESGWAKAVWGKLYGAWLCGSAVFVCDTKMIFPEKLLSAIEKYKITTLCAPPTIYRYLLLSDLSKHNLSSIKRATVAGEVLSDEVYNEFFKACGIQLHEAYGQTETVVLAGNFGNEKIKRPSMGKASPMFDLHIVDENEKDCPIGNVGEIVIFPSKKNMPGIFDGYCNNSELNKKAFNNGVYHTNDLAYMDSEGYLFFCGRKDYVIKTSGFRVSPYEVEAVLLKHEAVFECAVFGIADQVRGKKIKALIVLKENYKASDSLKKQIMEYLKENLSAYKRPRVLEFTQSLPKTISGKIKRSALK